MRNDSGLDGPPVVLTTTTRATGSLSDDRDSLDVENGNLPPLIDGSDDVLLFLSELIVDILGGVEPTRSTIRWQETRGG